MRQVWVCSMGRILNYHVSDQHLLCFPSGAHISQDFHAPLTFLNEGEKTRRLSPHGRFGGRRDPDSYPRQPPEGEKIFEMGVQNTTRGLVRRPFLIIAGPLYRCRGRRILW